MCVSKAPERNNPVARSGDKGIRRDDAALMDGREGKWDCNAARAARASRPGREWRGRACTCSACKRGREFCLYSYSNPCSCSCSSPSLSSDICFQAYLLFDNSTPHAFTSTTTLQHNCSLQYPSNCPQSCKPTRCTSALGFIRIAKPQEKVPTSHSRHHFESFYIYISRTKSWQLLQRKFVINDYQIHFVAWGVRRWWCGSQTRSSPEALEETLTYAEVKCLKQWKLPHGLAPSAPQSLP